MTNIVKTNISRSGDEIAYNKVHLFMGFKELIFKRLRLIGNKTLSVTGVWRNGANSYDTIIYELLECRYCMGGFDELRVDSSGAENWLHTEGTKETM